MACKHCHNHGHSHSHSHHGHDQDADEKCCGSRPEVDEDESDEDPSVLKRRIALSAVLLVVAIAAQRLIEVPLWAQLVIFQSSLLPAYGDLTVRKVNVTKD